jgi:hypothetical protein
LSCLNLARLDGFVLPEPALPLKVTELMLGLFAVLAQSLCVFCFLVAAQLVSFLIAALLLRSLTAQLLRLLLTAQLFRLLTA